MKTNKMENTGKLNGIRVNGVFSEYTGSPIIDVTATETDQDKTNEKLGEILQLCLQLQASGWGDVNCDVAGHVGKVEVRGFKGGWAVDNDTPTFSKYVWYNDKYEFSTDNNLDDLVTLLKSYIND